MQFPYIVIVGSVIGGLIGTVATMHLRLPERPPEPRASIPGELPPAFVDPPGVTPQQRIDQTFRCLQMHHYGVSCPGDTAP